MSRTRRRINSWIQPRPTCRPRRPLPGRWPSPARPAIPRRETAAPSPERRPDTPEDSPFHGATPTALRGQGQDPVRGPRARHPRPVLQGRRHRLQRAEEGHHHRQGRAQQPHQRIPDDAAERDRRAHPLHPPPEHARAADPRGGDHPARDRGAQRRRRQPLDAPRHRRKARGCRARSSSTTTRTTSSTTRWSARSTSPPSAGPPPRTSTTWWR